MLTNTFTGGYNHTRGIYRCNVHDQNIDSCKISMRQEQSVK